MKSNSFVKVLFFLLLFLVILTMFLIVFIIPEMKEYKTKQAILKKYEKIYDKNRARLNILKIKRDLTYKKYKNDILKYNNKFDFDTFKKVVNQNFVDANVKQMDNNKSISINATLNSMKDFYKFVNILENYSNIVKINFPLVYKVNNNIVKINFDVTICKNKLNNK